MTTAMSISTGSASNSILADTESAEDEADASAAQMVDPEDIGFDIDDAGNPDLVRAACAGTRARARLLAAAGRCRRAPVLSPPLPKPLLCPIRP